MADVTTDSEISAGAVSLPAYLFDGYLVHQAVLSRGLKVLLLPRQVLLAGESVTVPAQISFTHGVPQASTLSGVTFAQDRRLRRALFERAGVPKPAGASFSHRSLKKADAWALRKGYPVSVKEAISENDGTIIRHINSAAELEDAFTTLRRREAGDRAPGSNPHISGYTTTRLTFTVDDDGNELAPLRTRMLVEKEVAGTAIRAFVADGEVIAVYSLDQERSSGVGELAVSLTPEQNQTLVDAAQSIPGLAYATVDAVLVPRRRVFGKPRLLVTELSERPRLQTIVSGGVAPAEKIAATLVLSAAKSAGLQLPEPQSELQCELDIEGLRDPQSVANAIPALYSAHGVDLTILDVDEVMGRVRARCSGDVRSVAALNELLMAGLLIDDRAAAIEYKMGNSND